MSSKKRIGYMTSMYAFGAFVAPLIVTFYLKCGLSWKTLFIIIAVASALSFAYMHGITDKVQEKEENSTKERDKKGFILSGVLLLCLVMAIYVGFENGFAFFIDSMFSEELASTLGKFAISIFWIVMIPSRMLVGSFEKYSRKILLVSVIAIPAITVLISTLNSAKLILMLCVPLGFFSGAIYPCSLNLAMPLSGKSKALATGMITTATGLGGFIFTAITGILGNYIGLRTAIMLLATPFVFSLLAVLILIFNKSYKKETT
jgi:predicted MFS family arabinose efflux permease